VSILGVSVIVIGDVVRIRGLAGLDVGVRRRNSDCKTGFPLITK
jgi:hypothetical protein